MPMNDEERGRLEALEKRVMALAEEMGRPGTYDLTPPGMQNAQERPFPDQAGVERPAWRDTDLYPGPLPAGMDIASSLNPLSREERVAGIDKELDALEKEYDAIVADDNDARMRQKLAERETIGVEIQRLRIHSREDELRRVRKDLTGNRWKAPAQALPEGQSAPQRVWEHEDGGQYAVLGSDGNVYVHGEKYEPFTDDES